MDTETGRWIDSKKMNEWVGGWVDWQTDRRTDGWMDGWMDGWVVELLDWWVNGHRDRQRGRQTDGYISLSVTPVPTVIFRMVSATCGYRMDTSISALHYATTYCYWVQTDSPSTHSSLEPRRSIATTCSLTSCSSSSVLQPEILRINRIYTLVWWWYVINVVISTSY